LQAFADAPVPSAAVDVAALVRAVAQATGLPLVDAISDIPLDDQEDAAGRYVVYAGAKQTVVNYSGTCDQQPIAGSLTAFQVGTEGVLDCSTEPPADSLGEVARQWCDDA
jgi:hypothetical protein